MRITEVVIRRSNAVATLFIAVETPAGRQWRTIVDNTDRSLADIIAAHQADDYSMWKECGAPYPERPRHDFTERRRDADWAR